MWNQALKDDLKKEDKPCSSRWNIYCSLPLVFNSMDIHIFWTFGFPCPCSTCKNKIDSNLKPPLKNYITKFEDLKVKDGFVDKPCQLCRAPNQHNHCHIIVWQCLRIFPYYLINPIDSTLLTINWFILLWKN